MNLKKKNLTLSREDVCVQRWGLDDQQDLAVIHIRLKEEGLETKEKQ
jgi:hypothetical protein